jgi:hypothetical protein
MAARIKLPVPVIWTPGMREDARNSPSMMMSVRKIIPFIATLLGAV